LVKRPSSSVGVLIYVFEVSAYDAAKDAAYYCGFVL
jgi:hypothetical protein